MNTLKKRIRQIRGISYKPNQVSESPKEGFIPLLRATNILSDQLDLTNVIYVDKSLVKEEQILKNGDILMAASSGSLKAIGKSAMYRGKGSFTFGAFCKVIRPIDIEKDYLRHYFKTHEFKRSIHAQINGANIKNLNKEHIDNLTLFFPNLYEQGIISQILNTTESLIKKRQYQIVALDELAKSIFLEMFGNPDKNSMFPSAPLKVSVKK